ncbi:CDP-diacylglycerol--serine O-phosphatidyltransferase [Parashewanella curva]|uniref:CDP-diacylglycerol--serine O-phosphatidyltransferase n=1 Tax=Parashewanella curva TaxID=2338552 RepID=A0A3L8PXA4_9GAMM|nr:CDP-diacylglycerol--serine O-phosphatidyltransferase [Parashewanella curva]RLV59263.1 CDP-diacylglycerol--serine O-phosphatidyltransferase [Parashewanella curva]
MLSQLSGIPISTDSMSWLLTAEMFRKELLKRIANAQQSIYISALYLEDDEAGREIIDALLAVKKSNPELDVKVFVDFHRARRGLIGHKGDSGNYFMYRDKLSVAEHPIEIYGVPVKSKEILGVLHLKGFVIDDSILFSGASLNNIYLHHSDKYRFDRYHVIESERGARTMKNFMKSLLEEPAVVSLAQAKEFEVLPTKTQIKKLKSRLTRSNYEFSGVDSGLRITPLVGLGKRKNALNKAAIAVVKESIESLFICTPYFNPPYSLSRALTKHLKQGKKLEIVVGDKTANDFFIPPEEDFSTIGAVPYIYEQALLRFLKRHQWAVDKGLLKIHLWKHDHHSFHLKGISADNKYHLLTGSNLNPRAWSLDLENGILVHDVNQEIEQGFTKEREHILQNTNQVSHYTDIDTLQDYPEEVKKILTRIKRLRADFILRRIM